MERSEFLAAVTDAWNRRAADDLEHLVRDFGERLPEWEATYYLAHAEEIRGNLDAAWLLAVSVSKAVLTLGVPLGGAGKVIGYAARLQERLARRAIAKSARPRAPRTPRRVQSRSALGPERLPAAAPYTPRAPHSPGVSRTSFAFVDGVDSSVLPPGWEAVIGRDRPFLDQEEGQREAHDLPGYRLEVFWSREADGAYRGLVMKIVRSKET